MLRFFCWYWYSLFPHICVILTHVQPGSSSNKKVITYSFKVLGISIVQEVTHLSVVNGLGVFGELA